MPSDDARPPGAASSSVGGFWRNGGQRYATASIALHWMMVALLAAVYASIELRELFPAGSDTRESLRAWHYTLGLWVFVLVWLRLVLIAVAGPQPPISPEPRPWQALIAGFSHLALYLLMIGMPLLGWVILGAEGKPLEFLGAVLPAPIGENRALAHTIEEVHETAGVVGYWLIGLHAAAALFHHYWVRDNTLRRMLPLDR